jgi:hypothetical protein
MLKLDTIKGFFRPMAVKIKKNNLVNNTYNNIFSSKPLGIAPPKNKNRKKYSKLPPRAFFFRGLGGGIMLPPPNLLAHRRRKIYGV